MTLIVLSHAGLMECEVDLWNIDFQRVSHFHFVGCGIIQIAVASRNLPLAMVTGIDIERRWGFLKPWTDVLRRQHPNELCRLQSSPFDPDQLYVLIILPKRVFQDEAQMVQEGLKLLAAVAHVDYDAWKYLLLNYCGVEDLVEILGVQQHNSLRREYSEALARIAAMDNSLDTKRWGLEISVPIEVLFIKENGEERTLDELFRLHDAKEIIRRDWDERSLPQIEAGAFRCNFVLSAMKAKLEKYREPVDLDMAKRIDELVHDNVWFSRVSRKLGRGRGGKLDWEADSHTLVTLQHLDRTSFSTLNEWEALRSSAILSQTTREWNLPYVAGLWHSKHWWKWLAYSFFSKQARMRSPLESIALTDIESMATTEIESFCGILSSESPEEELLDCACEFSGVQDATLAANSPIRWDFDEQNEPVLSSDVLKFASPIPFLRILSKSGETEWVDVVVPGYGRCQVQRENLELNEEVGILPGYNLKALKIHFPRLETVDISGLPLFFAAVGSSLRTLTIDSGEEVDVDVSMVLERCPNLEQMCLVHREQDVSILNFSDFHAAGSPLPTIMYNMEDIPVFTEELMNRDSALTSCLQRLTIFYNNCRCSRNRRPPQALKRDLDALLKMLESNERLEYLCIGLFIQFREYVGRFRKFHLQPINRSVKLDVQSKIAFLSVLSTTSLQKEKRNSGRQLE